MDVLIVDDARESRMLLERFVRRLGFVPRVAADGQEAWALLEREPVPIVISDWMMPKLDGTELCRRIRAGAFAALQRSFLPPPGATLQGVHFEWLFLPSSFVAGDGFNYFPLDPGHLGLYLLDVAGHGVSSALLSVSPAQLLTPRALGGDASPVAAERATPPAEAMHKLNERFQFPDDSMMFFTISYGVFDSAARTLELSQAGHPSPLLCRDGHLAAVAGDEEGGVPIGMFPAGRWSSLRVTLRPGDRVFFYSDGIVECAAPDGTLFGEEHLADFLVARCDLPLRAMLDELEAALRAFRGGAGFDDDVSLLALQVAA